MSRRSLIHEIEARERRGRWFPALAGLIVIALLGATWIGLFTFMGANAAYGTFSDLEDEWVPDVADMTLSFPDLSRVSRVYAKDGEQLAELHDGRISEPTPISAIPEMVIHAILAAEDSDFYEHEGVDFQAIASAAIDNIISDSTRGGSTITQQIAKNLFVGDEVSIQRKVNEAFVAAELERRYSKDQILEYYINSVFFGSNSYGITAAAREYFEKDLDELAIHEAATLAVLVRNPTFYNPRKRASSVLDRRDSVIDEMHDQGWITQAQATVAKRQPLQVADKQSFVGQADHVVAEVTRQLLNEDEFSFLGATREERKRAIFGCPADDVTCTGGGGLRIETTIDLTAQLEANRVLASWLPTPVGEDNVALCQKLFPNDPIAFLEQYATIHSCAPTGAIATVENDTGAVRVMASGLPFAFNQFDLAVQGRRNPGSSMKPITLVAALEGGEITLGSYYNASQTIEIDCPLYCVPNPWVVNNAGGSQPVTTLNTATSSSINTVYAQVAVEIGPDKIVDMAHRMGIESELTPVPSLTLGASAVSPLEMASAYSNFATNGLHAHTYIIERILTEDGKPIYQHQVTQEQIATPAIFAAARDPLTRVPTSAGTAPRANIGRPQGGKTGTHQNYQEAWFVGFVPQYSTAVWVGYEAEQIPLRNVTINGTTYARVFGGTVPAPIWAEFMTWYVRDTEPASFPENPPGTELYFITPTTFVPSVIGLLREQAEQEIAKAKLAIQVIEVPSADPVGTVVSQDLIAGSEVDQGSAFTIEVASGQAPALWVPNYIGQPFELVRARFLEFSNERRLGLTIERIDVSTPNNPSDNGMIIAMEPGVGETIGFGTLIRLYVGS
jgi:membrane peptidoglycan carboxypeptidase